MFCTGCGSPINSSERFCHHCGKQLATGDGGHPPARQKTAPWVFVTGLALLALLFYVSWASAQYGDLEKPARGQLETIKEGKIPEAYYEYTSKQFQASTTLEQFRDFINSHQIISQYNNFSFGEPEISDNRGIISGELEAASGEKIGIKYFLFRQDDEWKIDSFQIVDAAQEVVESTDMSPKEKEAILDPIEEQLQDLKRGDVNDAYEGVSEGFKKVTSLPQFEEFVKQYHILTQFRTFNILEQLRNGEKAAVKIELVNQDERIPIEYFLIKEDDAWKIWSLRVLMPAENLPPPSLMVEPVQGQLEALKSNEIEKAYNDFASDEFKNITPLETFKTFMVNFPIFTSYETVEYKKPRIEESGGKLLVVLTAADASTATVEYTLGVSEGKWKIWGLKLVDFNMKDKEPQQTEEAPVVDETALKALANEQLQAINQKDFRKAYDQYTSKQFRDVTSFETFKRFMDAYPIFTHDSDLDFGKMTVNNNIATIKALLNDEADKSYDVEYDFVQDQDQWKILRVQLLEPNQEAEQDNTYFGPITMGTALDESGTIIKPTTVFDDPKSDIYTNIYVNGVKGDVITVIFKHNDTQSAIKPVSSTPLPRDGEFRTAFSFTPPPQGWPKGDYQLEIRSSNGEGTIYKFKQE